MSRWRFLSLLFSLGCALLATGCAHYQLGTGSKLSFTTLYVEPVASRAAVPQARELVSAQLRETLLRDGRVTIVNSPEAADAVLTVVLTDYRRGVTAVREGDTGLARKFDLILGATCTLRDNRGNKDIFAGRVINATRQAFTDSGQLQSEYQTLPLLAESLSAKIAHAALGVW